ncbi:hypothetical protein M5K25_024864 [Dendrobium thyrsiflorum]|uniref:DUF4283 domain-containing protein n=1 Tax=Dendrobium thyrsiflorum TaxID=117978 RepID=A0ABD0U3C2_DENTH
MIGNQPTSNHHNRRGAKKFQHFVRDPNHYFDVTSHQRPKDRRVSIEELHFPNPIFLHEIYNYGRRQPVGRKNPPVHTNVRLSLQKRSHKQKDKQSKSRVQICRGHFSSPKKNHTKMEDEPASKNLNLSFYPSEPEIIPFSGEKLSKGAEDWSLCLVGYSVGRRPFYEALQEAIKKTWPLKGSIQILSLSEGFFLFRFSCFEDYDSVWSRGVWFILGRPFILQQWHPKFKLKRENLTSVPILIKIHDLPLACWNSEDPSLISVDAPMAPPPRGRSISRKPRVRHSKATNQNPSHDPAPVNPPGPSLHQDTTTTTNAAGLTLHFQPHSPTYHNSQHITLGHSELPPPIVGKPSVETATSVPIPNLNSPTEETSSSSSDVPSLADPPQPGFTSPNKFDLLLEQDISTNMTCPTDVSDVVKNVTAQASTNPPTNSGVPKKPTRACFVVLHPLLHPL